MVTKSPIDLRGITCKVHTPRPKELVSGWQKITCDIHGYPLIDIYPGSKRPPRIRVYNAVECYKDPKYQRKKDGLSYFCRIMPKWRR